MDSPTHAHHEYFTRLDPPLAERPLLVCVCTTTFGSKAVAMSDQTTGVWWAIQCKPRQESRAQANLETSGVRTFLPLARHVASGRSTRKWIAKTEPLFPRYLFARCDAPNMAHRIRFARGVTKILGTDNRPTAVDESIITAIRQRVAQDGCVSLTPVLRPGDPVRVVAGPLQDFVGVFEASVTGTDRVRLLLAVLHGQWRAVVDDCLVERR
jgi:transcriptional antiterminator RfaH